jgi:hypothetical protein
MPSGYRSLTRCAQYGLPGAAHSANHDKRVSVASRCYVVQGGEFGVPPGKDPVSRRKLGRDRLRERGGRDRDMHSAVDVTRLDGGTVYVTV